MVGWGGSTVRLVILGLESLGCAPVWKNGWYEHIVPQVCQVTGCLCIPYIPWFNSPPCTKSAHNVYPLKFMGMNMGIGAVIHAWSILNTQAWINFIIK